MKHEHDWNLSFTGRMGGTSFAYYRCQVCNEIEEREEEAKVQSKELIRHTFGNGI